ncbi:MAG: AAA family ATPase [Deltaproteobacteria bacterium]|nr:AAA family ATPase [Deltaproteobacteria bacterium]
MSTIIAVAGKGGTGKTTVLALLIHYLLKNGKRPILAVDADADSNLADALGLSGDRSLSTIGKAREDFFQTKGSVPAGMPKEAYFELKLNEVLIESRDIDLLIMGRPEGVGCYCFINNVLRKYLETLGGNYPFVIIDNEAGLEHLSRRTTNDVDCLLIVSDYSLNGLRAAARIRNLAQDLRLKVKKFFLIINNAPSMLSEQFLQELHKLDIDVAGCLPEDSLIPQYDIERRSLLTLPEDEAAVMAMEKIAQKILT